MGLWSFLTGGVALGTSAGTPAAATPWSPQDSLLTALEGELFGVDDTIVTRTIAQRVPGLKRAAQIHCDIVSAMPLHQYKDGVKNATQPRWLSNSASGIAPLIRTKGLVADLFWEGFALLGCRLDGEQIDDAIHIPRHLWGVGADQKIEVNDAISREYTQRLILIPLGANGVMADGVDSIRQARALELARRNRLNAPPASTEIHLTDARFDEMTAKEKEKLAQNYADTRRKHSVSVTPSYAEVKEHGSEAVDLFDSATNGLRLDLANHASVPASIIEGAKGGGGGDMNYSGKGDERSELYDLGSRQFAEAIAARLSMDDVCPEGEYIAFDKSEMFAVPMPTTAPNLED